MEVEVCKNGGTKQNRSQIHETLKKKSFSLAYHDDSDEDGEDDDGREDGAEDVEVTEDEVFSFVFLLSINLNFALH